MSITIDRIESDVTIADGDASPPAADIVAMVIEELERRRRQAEGDALLERAVRVRRRAGSA